MEQTNHIGARVLPLSLLVFSLVAMSSQHPASAQRRARTGGSPACTGSWAIEPNPAGPGSFLFGVAAISSTDAWTVGYQAGGNFDAALVEHWDGATWSLFGVPHPSKEDSFLFAVSGTASDDVWAVGYIILDRSRTLIEHWDGATWSVVPSPSPGSFDSRLYGVAAISATDAWAVGDSEGTSNEAMIEHWDGATWSVVSGADLPGDFSHLAGVSGSGPNDVWAVGQFTNGHDGVTQGLTEHWDGATWQALPAVHHLSKANLLTGVAAFSPSSVLATGFKSDGIRTFGIRWDGGSWSTVITELVGHTINALEGVSADAAGDAWTVGYYYIPGDSQSQTLIEQWDGSSWHIVDSPNDGVVSSLYGVATVSAGEAWAVGQNGSYTALIEHYC